MDGEECLVGIEPEVDVCSEPSTSYSLPLSMTEKPDICVQSSDSSSCNVSSRDEPPFSNLEQRSFLGSLSQSSSSLVVCGPNECYFETDHPIFKNSEDYRKLLYTVVKLIELREQAIKDLDKLYDAQDRAMADPIGFVQKLQRGEDVGIPKPIKIPSIPEIDWSKYSLTKEEAAFSKQPYTRQSTKGVGDVLGLWTKTDGGKAGKGKSNADHLKSKFSQPWTSEEQKRLEALLSVYPTEEIETRRWEKIAKALGNRTPTQVASRVQKYFIKLARFGLPIPGRQPSSSYMRKPKRQVIRQQPSTFLVSHTLPVVISEEDEFNSVGRFPAASTLNESSSDSEISDEDIDAALKDSPEYQELICLNKSLKKKQKALGLVQHVGFKCIHCDFEPIIGVRYHCTDCPPAISVDFCEDCINSNKEIGSHTSSHKLEPIHRASSAALDMDYMHFAGNYLDTNYMMGAP